MSHDNLLYPVLFGLVAGALHLVAFGADPMRDKGAEGVDTFQTDRVARAVDEAEKYLSSMREAILRAGDRQLEARVDRFAAAARALFRTVEQDPRDLTAARKYLSVYLSGARDATVKFSDLYARSRDGQARTDYIALLDDLETTFADRSQRLLTDNRTDLDVEISVLRDRLKTEA
jgi:5-bromo-4-chloroindolyl phosphate hydrolysis protein